MATIYMTHWMSMNERNRIRPADKWYLDFATRILPLVQQSSLFNNKDEIEQTEAAIVLSMYLQDAVSQTGGWKVFSDLYFSLYGTYLPFYPLTEEYVADEINKEDIAFVLWTLRSHALYWKNDPYTFMNPYDENLLALSEELYNIMDVYFEEAPIIEEPSTDSWIMGPDLLEIPATPLPEIIPGMKLSKDVERCLEYSKGKSLMYFTTYQDLRTFLVEVLKWENNPSNLLPELEKKKEFVVYANSKGILIGHNVAAYFCEAHNPMYDAKKAATRGYRILLMPGLCPFDLIKYGMAKGLLPDLQFPGPQGKELLHQNWDFITRYYLCEYYEGT